MRARTILFAAMILSGCSKTDDREAIIFNSADYKFKPFTVPNEEKKTFAESENTQYKKQYDDKILEMRKVYNELVKSYKESHKKYPDITANRLQEIEK